MFTNPAILVIIIFLVLAIALLRGVNHIANLSRQRALGSESDPIVALYQAKKDRDDAWALFDAIQDQIPLLPAGEKHTQTIFAAYDSSVSDKVLVMALKLLKDAGWNAILCGPGRMSLVKEKYDK